ncbi:MAG: UbiA family prenyltransferase, partial [Bdellovibrionales bacterium]|nr:UbiA family prenyltransferase [Bdellovibrionales bacterium]
MTSALIHTLDLYGKFVAFSHTIFALPFALAMMMIVHVRHPVSIAQLLLILLALVSARNYAMAFNRLVDRHIDAKNPRTAQRELPAGLLSLPQALVFFVANLALFLVAAGLLGTHCIVLAPVVVVILCGYSYGKR